MTAAAKYKLIKGVCIFLLAVLIAALETAIFPSLRIFGAVPRLLPFLVAAVAVYEGAAPGFAVGFFSGLLMDGLGNTTLFWYTVSMIIAGVATGLITPSIFRKRIPTAMLIGAIWLLLSEFLRFFFFFYLFSHVGFSFVWTVILPTLLYSAVLSPLVIWPVSRLYRRLREEPGLYR